MNSSEFTRSNHILARKFWTGDKIYKTLQEVLRNTNFRAGHTRESMKKLKTE